MRPGRMSCNRSCSEKGAFTGRRPTRRSAVNPLCRAKSCPGCNAQAAAPDGKVGKWWLVGNSGVRWHHQMTEWRGSSHSATRSNFCGDMTLAFRGHFEHSLDAKNRLAIPARFRAAFSGGTVLL